MSVNAVEQNLNKLFKRDFRDQEEEVILREVRKKNVVVQCPHRQDRKTMTLKEFNKKYRLTPDD